MEQCLPATSASHIRWVSRLNPHSHRVVGEQFRLPRRCAGRVTTLLAECLAQENKDCTNTVPDSLKTGKFCTVDSLWSCRKQKPMWAHTQSGSTVCVRASRVFSSVPSQRVTGLSPSRDRHRAFVLVFKEGPHLCSDC